MELHHALRAPWSATAARFRGRTSLAWIAAAVACVVLLAAVVTAVVAAVGGDDRGRSPAPSPVEPSATVDLTPEAVDARYDGLASRITAGATDCAEGTPGTGEREVVECAIDGGSLRLVTYEGTSQLAAARATRLDRRAGTLSADYGVTAHYQYDPGRRRTAGPAVVYWDSADGPQAATITGATGTPLRALVAAYTATSPRVVEPVNPQHPLVRDFIDINMSALACTRQHTSRPGQTEESACRTGVRGIAVTVGRHATERGLRQHRRHYQRLYRRAETRGHGPTWKFGDGRQEGAFFGFVDRRGKAAVAYWDWDNGDCHCYAVATHRGGDLDRLQAWWPSDG